MVLTTHPPVTEGAALTYLRAMTRTRIDGKRSLDPSKPWDFISGLAARAMEEEEGCLLVLRLVGDIVRVNFENWSKGRPTQISRLKSMTL